MKSNSKWILFCAIISLLLFSLSSTGVVAQTELSQTRVVQHTMTPTLVGGIYENSTVQTPTNTVMYSTITKSLTAQLLSYQQKVNVSLLSGPERLQLNCSTLIRENYTGTYLSSAIQLDTENTYFWDNITLDLSNISYKEDIDQLQTLWTQIYFVGRNPGTLDALGQSFIPAESEYTKIQAFVGRVGAPIDFLKMELYNTLAGLPIGPPLATDMVPGIMLVQNTVGLYNFTIRYRLAIGVQYCFILSRTGPQDQNNFYLIGFFPADAYPSGTLIYTQGGLTYKEPSSDLVFKTFYFVDSAIKFSYRNSTNGASWSSWGSTRLTYINFSRHLDVINIHQNKTQYLQFQINFSSNNPAYRPTCYSVILYWLSYTINYTISEFDKFSYTHLGTPTTIHQINISIHLEINIPYIPETGWVKLYNITGKQWDTLLNGVASRKCILKGANLTTYYNGSLYLLFYYFNSQKHMELTKTKQIFYNWSYYFFDEKDQMTFNVETPIRIILNATYKLSMPIYSGNVFLLNVSNGKWISLGFGNETNYLIPLSYYNGTINIWSIATTLDPVTIQKELIVTVFYLPSATGWPEWATWTLVSMGAALIGSYLVLSVYRGYIAQRVKKTTILMTK